MWVTSGRVIKLLKSAGRGGLFSKHHAVQIFYCSGLHIKWRMRRTPAAPRDVPGIVKKPKSAKSSSKADDWGTLWGNRLDTDVSLMFFIITFFSMHVSPPPPPTNPPLKSQFYLKKEKELVPMYTITCLNSHVHTSCIYHNLHVSVNRVTMHFEDLYKQCRYKLTNTRQKKISVCIWLFYKWFKSCGSLFCNIFAILNNC